MQKGKRRYRYPCVDRINKDGEGRGEGMKCLADINKSKSEQDLCRVVCVLEGCQVKVSICQQNKR